MMDPQQRLLLDAAASMFAATAAATIGVEQERQQVGVYVGISSPDYSDLKKVATPIGVYSATGEHKWRT